jgi:hypothetical protein
VFATATDKDSHDLFHQGLRVAVDCANPEREAERAWAVTKDTTTIAVLDEFVRRYGDSRYAALARARMEELRKSQAAAQTTVEPQPSVAATIVPKMPSGASSRVLAPAPTTANPSPQQLAPPASQAKISDRVGQPPAQSDTAQPANSPGSGLVAAVAQRVVLYEEDQSGAGAILPRSRMRLARQCKCLRVRTNLWREPTSPGRGRMRQEVETAARRDLVRWSS